MNKAKARAFLKWAGGKYSLVDEIKKQLPEGRKLIEPFVGAGSVFLNTDYQQYLLCDINPDLISLYNIVKQRPQQFLEVSQTLIVANNNQQERYYQLREEFNSCSEPLRRAALFLYLNRHGYNGLCRYNRSGGFNVPFGKYDSPKCPVDEMRFFHKYFEGKEVLFNSLSFEHESLYSSLGEGDVLYMDPPYVPATETANFTSYATEGFTHEQQVKLSNIAEELSSKGVKVIISNHDVPITRELYKNAKIYGIQVTRTISAKSSSRKKASELIAVYG